MSIILENDQDDISEMISIDKQIIDTEVSYESF